MDSLKRLQALNFSRIAPTHFGIYDDPQWQISSLQKILEVTEIWLEDAMAEDLSIDALRDKFTSWMESQGREQGLSDDAIRAYDLANPLGMSADGMMRYWRKVKNPDNSTNVTRKV
jgi:hypothetical protein